ncbi:MAG: uracil-DNA glycosylase family protein [Halobacteriales archaeon]
MKNVTEEVSNPFGMRPPCPHRCVGESERRAVFGYGDANADFHVIGNHSAVHGGAASGVPFTGDPAGERVLDVLEATGFLLAREAAELTYENCFTSYRYLCCVPPGTAPDREQLRDFERFFDAELRAVAADVLVPVGEAAIRHVIESYTAQEHRLRTQMADLHGTEVRGRGFMVLPIQDPREWGADGFDTIVTAIEELLAMDYHQEVDLGRFIADADPYYVR